MKTRADALAWLERHRRWEETRALFAGFSLAELAAGRPEDITSAKVERYWRLACGQAGIAQATADEMRDPVVRGAQMRRALRLARIPRAMRRDVLTVLKHAEPVVDARFATLRALCPSVG